MQTKMMEMTMLLMLMLMMMMMLKVMMMMKMLLAVMLRMTLQLHLPAPSFQRILHARSAHELLARSRHNHALQVGHRVASSIDETDESGSVADLRSK
jgi:hypothetical protein